MASETSQRETRRRKQDTDRAAYKQIMGEEDPPAWAQQLMTQINSIKNSFEPRFDEISESIKGLKKDTRAALNRMSNAEKRIGELEDQRNADKKVIKDLSKDVDYLKSKVTLLESHSKRNNLVLMGLEEGLLEASDQKEVMAEILRYVLDLKPTAPTPEVERQHRSLRPRPDPTEPPRPYLIRLLRWDDRQSILRAASKKKLTWKGKPFYIHQDLPVELQRKRAEYTDIRKKLRGTNYRYGILHPSRLIVTIDGKKHIFKNPEEATTELKKHLPNIFG